MYSAAHSANMLSPGEIAQIKAEIQRLEKLRKECTDGGIRERIEAWIKAETQKLEFDRSTKRSNE
jgi:hypothetical protein